METPQTLREQRRSQAHELSRGQLLDAAEEVIGRKGFHETTLKEIAERAGFSVGSVYSFFESKDDLFRHIFLRRGEEFMAGMRVVLHDPADDPRTQLHALADYQVGYFHSHANFARVYLRYSSIAVLAARNDQVDAEVQQRYDEAMQQQAELFRRGQTSSQFRRGDPQALSRLFSGLVSAYQAIDTATANHAGDRLSLADFHAVISGAFFTQAQR